MNASLKTMARRATPAMFMALILALSLCTGMAQANPEAWRSLVNETTRLQQNRQWEASLEPASQALKLAEDSFGPNHLNTATSLSRLAQAHAGLNHHEEAIGLMERELAILEKSYGPSHRNLIPVLARLVNSHIELGRYARAQVLAERNLALVETSFEPDHPWVLETLSDLARSRQAQGNYEGIAPLYLRAIAISVKLNGESSARTADLRSWYGTLLGSVGQHQEAVQQYQAALSAYASVPGEKPLGMALTVARLASAYTAMGRYAEALPLAERAAADVAARVGPGHARTAEALEKLAYLLGLMGKHEQALPLAERVLAISEKVHGPNHVLTLDRMGALANVYLSLGQHPRALALMQRSLDMQTKLLGSEALQVGNRLGAMAFLHEEMGEYSKALPLYQKALGIVGKQLGPEHAQTATLLGALGRLYMRMDQDDLALPAMQSALAISEKSSGPNHPLTAEALVNLANLYRRTGQYGLALPLYKRAVQISAQSPGPGHPRHAGMLSGLAGLYFLMGQNQEALPFFERALAIAEKYLGPGHSITGDYMLNLGVVRKSLGQYREALSLFEGALGIAVKAYGDEHSHTVKARQNIASLLASGGQYDRAIGLYQKALRINEKSDGLNGGSTASLLTSLGLAYQATGQTQQALSHFVRAYAIATRLGQPGALRRVQYAFAGYYKSQNQTGLAIYFGKEAVNTVQSMRSNAKGLDRDLQDSLLNMEKGIYERLAGWLIEEGRLREAQQVIAMMKEDELQGFIVRGDGADVRQSKVGYNGVEVAWSQMSRQATGELGALARQVEALQSLPPANLGPEQKRQLEALLDQASQAQTRFEALLARIQTEARSAGQRASDDARSAAERARNNLRDLLDKLAEEGAARPAALQYLVTDERLFILVSLPNLQFAREVKISSTELRRQVATFRLALQNPRIDPRPSARQLHDLLIAPVRADLESAGTRHLMVSLTDVLRYVPFAALHDGRQYLMESYQLSVMTEAALGARMDKPRSEWTVGALGVSDKVSAEFAALPAVSGELRGIVRSPANPSGVLAGDMFLNGGFTAASYRDVIQRRPSVIHIATHFKLSQGTEAQSFLLLGDGKPLSLSEMMSDRFRFRGLDLLTLSACETALSGGLNQDGREVEGLGAQAQRYGAPAVIATLWQVADESTGQLMQRFYALRALQPAQNKSEALRLAQMELLKGDAGSSATPSAAQADTRGARAQGGERNENAPPFARDPAKPHAHPFFWAPFVLMGNWL